MKRNQSVLENAIAGCYFAVQPLTLCFLRDYDSSFNLYFEKGTPTPMQDYRSSPKIKPDIPIPARMKWFPSVRHPLSRISGSNQIKA